MIFLQAFHAYLHTCNSGASISFHLTGIQIMLASRRAPMWLSLRDLNCYVLCNTLAEINFWNFLAIKIIS